VGQIEAAQAAVKLRDGHMKITETVTYTVFAEGANGWIPPFNGNSAESEAKRPPIPIESGQPIRTKAAALLIGRDGALSAI
jgi:hypothetical protein